MEFKKLRTKERALLLKALNFDINKLKCQHCEEAVSYKNCCIMPSIMNKKDATILCKSLLCMAWYLEGVDEDDS